jgi:putative nucleotidyltransferase with HDIG domain
MLGDVDSRLMDELRSGVRESLPEIELIGDQRLKELVVEAHALALSGTEFRRIEDIPGEGDPGVYILKRGTQAEHYRGVATMALGMADGLEAVMGSVGVDRDILVAAALCHDLGKAWEFSPRNRERWTTQRRRYGLPSVRHPVYGVHIALMAGLPEEVVHVVGAHPYFDEGAAVVASLENSIVQFADFAFWKNLEAADMLLDNPPRRS